MLNASFTYAGRLERLFSNLLDTLILLVPSFTLSQALAVNPGLALMISFFCNLAYYTYFTGSDWQATPGKRLLSIYVIHADGTKLTTRDALERFLAYVLPSLPLYTSFIPQDIAPILTIGLSIYWFAPILLTEERIGVHDRICSTRVVSGKADAPRRLK